MADKLQSGIVALPVFVDGEQPPAGKLNSLGSQTQNGLTEIEQSVGDIHDESYPYSSSTGTHLTQEYGKNYTSGVELAGAIERRLDIANLARLIGPAANLNPTSLDIVGSILGEAVPASVHEFELRYLPAGPVNFSDAAVFATLKGSPSAIGTAGDYAVRGRTVYTATITTGGTANYDTNPLEWGQGGAYPHASFNVIPDPNQVDIGSSEQLGIAGPDINGRYTITLPKVRYQQTNYDQDNTQLTDAEDASYDAQLNLPYVLTENFTSGEIIPEGFLYLRNHTTGELYEAATYYYNSETSIQIAGVDLSGAGAYDYYLITVGSDITTSIDDLRNKQFKHRHDGDYGEPKINVLDLCGITKHAGASGAFCPSEIPGNFAPQYLHRDGLSADDGSNLNDRNGMRGWIAFCFQGQGAGDGFTPGTPALTATHGIFFGSSSSIYRGEIYKDSTSRLSYRCPSPWGGIPTSGCHYFTNGPVFAYEGMLSGSIGTSGADPWKVYIGDTTLTTIANGDETGIVIAGLAGKKICSVSAVINVEPIAGLARWVNGAGYVAGPMGTYFYFPMTVSWVDPGAILYFTFGDGVTGDWNNSDHDIRYVIHYTD